VRVANHVATLELLWCTIVVGGSADKVSSDHVLDVSGECELRVSREGAKILGVGDLCSWHVARRNDIPNDYAIATSLDQLLSIRKSLSIAKVDEVVGGGERSRLLVNRRILTIVCACRANNGCIQSQRGLRINSAVVSSIIVVSSIVVIATVLVATIAIVLRLGQD